MEKQSALDKLIDRCNEMDITEQLNWLGDANMPFQAKLELAALRAQVEAGRVLMQEAIDNCETGDCARCRTFADYIAALTGEK